MSFLSLSRSRALQATSIARLSRQSILPATSSQSSSFHSSASRSVLKESDRHRDEESDIGSEIEKHKQNQISQHKDGHDKASWAEELASASEENVKADRGEINDPTFNKLQDKLKSKHEKEGKQ